MRKERKQIKDVLMSRLLWPTAAMDPLTSSREHTSELTHARRGSLSIYPPTSLHHWLRGILGVGSPALPTHSVKVQCILLVWL